MIYLVLSHFDVIEGPKIFLKTPDSAKEEILEQVPDLLNLYDDGFFVQIFTDFKSTNLIFNISSDFARGNQEILLVSILLDIEKDIDLNLAHNLLLEFKRRLRKLPDAFKAFYLTSHKYLGDADKLEEVKELFLDFFDYSKSTIKALEEAEVRYRALFKAARDAIFIIDKESGIIVDANTQAEILLRRKLQYIKGMDAPDLQIEGEYEQVRLKVLEAVKSKMGTLIETVINNSVGIKIPVEITASEIRIGGRALIQCLFRDVTERKEAEAKIKESEEKYRLLVENQIDIIVKIDADGKLLYTSPTYLKVFGVKAQEIIGTTYRAQVHPDDAVNVSKAVRSLFKPPFIASYEQRTMTVEGWKWFSWVEKAILDSNQKVLEILSVGRDITRIKEAEHKLQESEERYRLIYENANDIIAILDSKFKVEYVNNGALLKTLGYTSQEIVGKSAVIFAHPEDQESAIQKILKGFKTGEAIGEFRSINKNSETIWFDVRGKLFKDSEGKDKGIIIARDITDRKRAEQRLIESEEKYRLIIENQSDLIIKIDSKGKVLFVSPTYCDIYGVEESELLGKKYNPQVHEDDVEIVSKASKFLFKPPFMAKYEHRVPTKDGWRWFSWIDKAIMDENKRVIEILSVGRDISKEQELKELIRESEKKYHHLFDN